MNPENEIAPTLGGRGDGNSNALATRSNPITDMPRGWRRHLPQPAAYFNATLQDMGEVNEWGEVRAACPFHRDPGRSLLVHMGGRCGAWRCNRCGARGDLISFHMRRLGVSTRDAIVDLIAVGARPRKRPAADAAHRLAECRELLQKGAPMTRRELATFERLKAEQRVRDELARRMRRAS